MDTAVTTFARQVSEYTAEYGAVPPPWVFSPRSHPFSIEWRMGHGQGLIGVFGRWWRERAWCEDERIAYFKQWPPPPRWIPWMAHVLWKLPSWEAGGACDCPTYYRRVTELGFPGVDQIERDLDDDGWRQDILDIMRGRAPRSTR